AAARAGDPRRGFQNQGPADGVQATRHGPAALAAPRWRLPVAAGPRRHQVHRRSSGRSSEKRYSVNRERTKGGRLIMTGQSTTFDNNSRLAPDKARPIVTRGCVELPDSGLDHVAISRARTCGDGSPLAIVSLKHPN